MAGAASGLKTLRDAVSRRMFDKAYYIFGEDDFQKEEAVKQLLDAALDPATRDFNLDIRRGSEVGAQALSELLSAIPLMADRRALVIREVGSLKRDARTVLSRNFQALHADMMLLLVEESGSKPDTELSRKCTPMQFDPLDADRVARWITHTAKTRFNKGVSSGAVDLLQSSVGNDLFQLTNELEKLANFCGSGDITEDAVAETAGVRRGETLPDLLDAVAARNAPRALELSAVVMAQPKTTAVFIVMALTPQTLAMSWGAAKLEEGIPRGSLRDEYLNLLRNAGSVYTGRPWGSAISAWANFADKWDRESLARALDALLEADIALKESRVSSEEQILATLILRMCAGEREQLVV